MNCRSLFVINCISIEIQVKSSEILWIVLLHIYGRFFTRCYQKYSYWMIVFTKLWTIVTNLCSSDCATLFFVSVFSSDCYVNIYIEEEKPRWTFWFSSHISIYRIVGGIEWTRLWHHQRKRKNNNNKTFSQCAIRQ